MEANQEAGRQNANDSYDENEKEAGVVGWLWRVLWLQSIVWQWTITIVTEAVSWRHGCFFGRILFSWDSLEREKENQAGFLGSKWVGFFLDLLVGAKEVEFSSMSVNHDKCLVYP